MGGGGLPREPQLCSHHPSDFGAGILAVTRAGRENRPSPPPPSFSPSPCPSFATGPLQPVPAGGRIRPGGSCPVPGGAGGAAVDSRPGQAEAAFGARGGAGRSGARCGVAPVRSRPERSPVRGVDAPGESRPGREVSRRGERGSSVRDTGSPGKERDSPVLVSRYRVQALPGGGGGN